MNSSNSGWIEEPLGSLAELRRGITYSADMLVDEGAGIPYINMKSFKKGGGFNEIGLKFFNGPYVKDDIAAAEDLLIANTDVTLAGDIVGIPAYLPTPIRQNKVLFSHHVTRIKLNNQVGSHYLYYLLNIDEYRRWMHKYARGTTVLMLDMTAIKRIPIRYPSSKNAQKKIVEKIEVFDRAIEKTEALIQKHQKIKAGLMHDLFIRGLTADGKLRPPREQAPELYKETPIGWIPKEWSTDYLKRYVRSAEYGISTSLDDLEDGIPILRMNNIQQDSFDISDLKYSDNPEAYRIKLRLKDVLYNRTNSMEHVGKTAIWKGELEECSFASYLVRINLHENILISEYFSYWMSQVSSQNAIRRFATPAVQQVNINPTNLQKIRISAPINLDEQLQIVDRLQSYDSVIDLEKQRMFKLKKQKSGLMHDLLTGKVPVKIDEEETGHV